MLVAAGDVVDDHVTRCRPHDDVAHLDPQGVSLQKDGLLFQRQLKITMDIYAKVKYNQPHELLSAVNGAFGQSKGK